MRPVVVVTGRHRPHEQLLLAYGAFSGALYLLGASPPSSIAATVPHWLVLLWSAGLVVSGGVGLIGCWGSGVRGLQLEQGGLLIGAGSLLIYVVAAFSFAGERALWAGGLVCMWAAAHLWRAWQCHRDLRQIKAAS
jgi:hypothetical protein